jgi:hypothetical protein
LWNRKGETPVSLVSDTGGGGILTLADEEGKYQIDLTAGLPSVLSISDEENKACIKLGFPVDKDGDFMPWLRFYDKNHNVVWQAPPREDEPEAEEAEGGEE